MCWLFLIDFFSIHGAPTVPYRGKRNRSKKVNTCRYFWRSRNPNLENISLCVDFFWPISFPYMVHPRCHIRAKGIAQKKSTHRDIFEEVVTLIWKISFDVLTFFDRSYCLFWETTIRTWGENFSKIFERHIQRGMVRQVPSHSAYCRTVLLSGCEFFPKEIFSPHTPLLVSQKRQ